MYTEEQVSCTQVSEGSWTAFQVFPFLTGFHSPFPIHHSLVFHLISSQFPPLLCHIFIETIVIFHFLPVESGGFIKTRLKAFMLAASPSNTHSHHQLNPTCHPAIADWRALNHLQVTLRLSAGLAAWALCFREPWVSHTQTKEMY